MTSGMISWPPVKQHLIIISYIILVKHSCVLQAAGEKDFAPDLEDMVKTGPQARPTVIRWAGGGKEVCITGSFNNWSSKIPMNKRYLCARLSTAQTAIMNSLCECFFCFFFSSHNDFVAILDLPEGEHQYKFFVDGQWLHDPSEVTISTLQSAFKPSHESWPWLSIVCNCKQTWSQLWRL